MGLGRDVDGASQMRMIAVGGLVSVLLSAGSSAPSLAQLGFELPESLIPAETRMRLRVASELPLPLLVQFRNVNRIATEAGHDIEFCGQVNGTDLTGKPTGYRAFLYMKGADAEHVQILDSAVLNGYRVGRKMIGALRRAGCLQ